MARTMARVIERISALGSAYEAGRWAFLQGAPYLAAFGVTAGAAWATERLAKYAPLSWVLAGFIGAAIWSLIRIVAAVAFRMRVQARYNASFLARGGNFNPLDLTFERQRIYINDFVLPSHPYIQGKTFIDCDIIGPANIYLGPTTNATNIRPPKVEGIWLAPQAKFSTGFTFDDCIFRNCSFQRITLFASAENYDSWKDNPNIIWIGVPPTREMILDRQKTVNEARQQLGLPPLSFPAVVAPASAKLIEAQTQSNETEIELDDEIGSLE